MGDTIAYPMALMPNTVRNPALIRGNIPGAGILPGKGAQRRPQGISHLHTQTLHLYADAVSHNQGGSRMY